MTSRDFCFWLQGYFEIHQANMPENVKEVQGLTNHQLEMVRKHLALVFVHEIDPSMGPPAHQVKLDAVHGTGAKPPGQVTQSVDVALPYQSSATGGPVFRC